MSQSNGSSTRADVSYLTWENLIANANALRQTLGFGRCAILGHSFGGMVALEYALRYPLSLSHLMLMDTCGDGRWAQHNAPEILAKRGDNAADVQAVRHLINGQQTPNGFVAIRMKYTRAYYYNSSLWTMVRCVILALDLRSRPEAAICGNSILLPG